MTSKAVFRVDDSVFDRFPTYIVGCVLARGVQTSGSGDAVIDMLDDAEFRSRTTYEDRDFKTLEPFAAWRDAFSAAGWSPSRFPASVEAIHRRVQRETTVPRIHPVVDLANAAVLFYSVPIGTHDVASLGGGELVVRHAAPGDVFLAMGDGADEPRDGEIVYACDSDIRTRRWVWRQSRTALVDASATEVFFPIDGFADRTLSAVEAAVNFIRTVCEGALGATVQTGIVSAEAPSFPSG